jgi:penicillin-binding protein 1A
MGEVASPPLTTRSRRRPFNVKRARIVLVALLSITFLSWLLWRRCGVGGCPNVHRLASYQPGGASILYDRDGKKFADLSPGQHRVVKIAALPKYVPSAFVAVEDKRFFHHNGVDYRRVGGALLANIKAHGVSQGFSTITMQLARNVWPDRLPGQQRTLKRKILEIRVARDIEKSFTKDEILELYLNHIYFGEGAYGIDAAAQNYFGKPARLLTLGEAATLAAMPKSPSLYNPRRHPERAAARRELVLNAMSSQRLVSSAESSRARRGVRVMRDAPRMHDPAAVAPYFVEALRMDLEDRFGEEIYASRLKIFTTLDRRAQKALEQQLEQQARAIERGAYGRYKGPRYKGGPLGGTTEYVQHAGIVMSADSGDVVALVGGRDFQQSHFNRATQARRQPGSAFKPFVYAAALEKGILPTQRIADTLHLEMADGEMYVPRNFDGKNRGDVTLRAALVQSRNVPTVRLAADIGMPSVKRVARRAGVESDIPNLPSGAIGSAAVTPLEITRAYSPFANLGETVEPRFVTRIEDGSGRIYWRSAVERRGAIKPAVAYMITNMLQEAVNSGTGTSVRLNGYRGIAAGKTGTTNDGADAWFVGYTPDYVATIWFGFDHPRAITSNASGGRLAAPVWGRLMTNLYANRAKARPWVRPATLVVRSTDPATGWILTEGCRPRHGDARMELFMKHVEPPSICPAGTPAHPHVSILRRLGGWFGAVGQRIAVWMRRHIGSERPTETPTDDRYLGTPRLPEATEVPEQITPEALRLPVLDSIQINAATNADSMIGRIMDTLVIDTIRLDTMQLDSMRRRMRRDSVARQDTMLIKPDTLIRRY